MARLSVTSTVTNEMADCAVKSIFNRWLRGMVSVGLNAMLLRTRPGLRTSGNGAYASSG